MGQKYKHFTQADREQLRRLLTDGVAVGKIAEHLGFHRSAIYRELKRNKHSSLGQYLPDTADKLSLSRRCRPGSKIERSKWLMNQIGDYLAMGWSPETISGRLELEEDKQIISHESIYKWIYGAGRSLELHRYLLRRKRKRGRRPCRKVDKPKIPDRTSIHKRPQEYAAEFGHWEADTVHFSGHKGAIVTLYEKTTKITLGSKMQTRKTNETISHLEQILSKMPSRSRKSITLDNGPEFTDHQRLKESLGLETYFCDTYASWQKGGVENANGILRRHVPKGSMADDYSDDEIQTYFTRMNGTPRKSLGYKTPYESFLQKLNPETKLMNLMNLNVALQI